MIGSMYGVSFVMLIVFLVISSVFIMVIVWRWHVDRVGKSTFI